jgi:hypothetical protein
MSRTPARCPEVLRKDVLMPDPIRHPGDGERLGEARSGRPPSVPRWVKVSGIVAGALVVLLIILKLTGLGGDHGHNRHLSDGSAPAVNAGAVPPLVNALR